MERRVTTSLPVELLFEIMGYLQSKDLVRFLAVSLEFSWLIIHLRRIRAIWHCSGEEMKPKATLPPPAPAFRFGGGRRCGFGTTISGHVVGVPKAGCVSCWVGDDSRRSRRTRSRLRSSVSCALPAGLSERWARKVTSLFGNRSEPVYPL